MATLTDYAVLSDAPFELDSTPANPIPSQKKFTWKAPSDLVQGVGLARPILSYIWRPLTKKASMGIWINHTGALKQSTRDHSLSWNSSASFDQGLWEAIQGTKIKVGRDNTIIFGLQAADSGRMRIRDVVLWFQRKA